jgi:hypothetical protein
MDEGKNDSTNKRMHLLKSQYTREELIPKYDFKEFSLQEITDLKAVKTKTVYVILEGKLNNMSVLLLKLRFFDKKSLNVILTTTPLFKVRSKYIVPKIGYIIDYDNGLFYTIYESIQGKILEFEDFYNFNVTEQSDLVKLYLFNTMMKLIHKLKLIIKDKFKIGLLEPNLFVFNIHDQIPLRMIDFTFYNYFSINNSNKMLDFLRPVFGLYDLMEQKSNDMATMKIMLAKLFLEDDSLDYNTLIYKYYLEYNIKRNISKKLGNFVINEWTKKDEKIFLFEMIVNQIKNQKVKDLILNWEKEKIGFFGSDVKFTFDEFYEKGFMKVFKEIQKEYKCYGLNCNEFSSQIYPFCFEPLCSKCYESHRCNATIFQELNVLYINIPKLEDEIQKIHQELISLVKIYPITIYSEYKQSVFKYHSGIKKILNRIRKKILYYEDYINCLINYIEKKFKRLLEIKFEQLDKLLKKFYNERDEIYSNKLQGEIEKCEKFIKDIQYMFDKISKSLSVYQNIENMYGVSFEYLKDSELYYNKIFTSTINEIYIFLNKYLKNIKLITSVLQTELITDNEKIVDIIFPVLGTNKLVRFFDIGCGGDDIEFKESEFELSFSKKFEEKIVPLGARYIRIKKFIFFSGGFIESNISGLRRTAVISIKDNKVKLRKGNMLFSRYNHSLIIHSEYFIIALGGYNNNTVEKYSIMKDTWSVMPNMNYKRANTSAIIIDNKLLYCYGGEHEGKFLDSIECLDLYKRNNWKIISIDKSCLNNLNNYSGSSFGITSKGEDIIYLIGGKVKDQSGEDYKSSNYIYEIDLKNNFMTKFDEKGKKGHFIENQLVSLGQDNYQFQAIFDGDKYNLFRFKSFYSNL